jgi:hypothetical protein
VGVLTIGAVLMRLDLLHHLDPLGKGSGVRVRSSVMRVCGVS